MNFPRPKPNSKTKQVLMLLNILAWVAFIGLLIETGAILFSLVMSLLNTEGTSGLYLRFNWEALRLYSVPHYLTSVAFVVVLSGMKAYVLYLSIKALSRVNMANPFSVEVSRILQKISYTLWSILIVAIVYNLHADILSKKAGGEPERWDIGQFIFMAGLVFIISQIFKRGVELQSEADLTV